MTGQLNGTCACGCGLVTNISRYDDSSQGIKAGQHFRFINGHYHKMMRRINPGWGSRVDRAKLREKRRGEIVDAILTSGGKKCLAQIAEAVAPEFHLAGVSMMVRNAREWGYYGDIPQIILRMRKQVIPLYERPDIPNERETEISLLTNRRWMVALDAPVWADGQTHHHSMRSDALTPLEILMLKEQEESEEERDRQKRIEEWNRWQIRKRSAAI